MGTICIRLCLIGLPYVVACRTQIHVLDVRIVVANVDDLARGFLCIGIAFGVGAGNAIDAWEGRIELGVFIHNARHARLALS